MNTAEQVGARGEMTRLEGLEPPTPGFEGRYSIRLSYKRTWFNPNSSEGFTYRHSGAILRLTHECIVFETEHSIR